MSMSHMSHRLIEGNARAHIVFYGDVRHVGHGTCASLPRREISRRLHPTFLIPFKRAPAIAALAWLMSAATTEIGTAKQAASEPHHPP